MISFIIPAKNAAAYIQDCLRPFVEVHDKYNFEVIIVDDHSTDSTDQIASSVSVAHSKIKVFKNILSGKVAAINYGFSICKGGIIKCVAADDVISTELFEVLSHQKADEAIFHDSIITNENLSPLAYFASNPSIAHASYEQTITKILSPPSGMWSVARSIATQIFPMPEGTPYEDVWFAFKIKKHAKTITHIPKSYYLYRQHSNQTFGGVLNFNEEVVRFRASRLKNLLPIVKDSELGDGVPESLFDHNIRFFEFVADQPWRLLPFLKLKSPFSLKVRYLMIMFFPLATGNLIGRLWKFRSKGKRL